jgi:Tfp pilus assembly protein PilO
MALENFSLVDKINQIRNEPKGALPLVVIILTIVFLGYKQLYAPKVVELNKELKKYKGLQGQLGQLQNASQNVDEITLNIEEQKLKFEKAKALCYRKSEMTAFLRRIRELANNAKIDIKSINPQPLTKLMVGEIETEQLAVTFGFSGDLVKLGIFLRMLELEEKITFTNLPKLVPNSNGIFEFNISPVTVLISDNLALGQKSDGEDFGEDFEEYE